jgi:ribonuclease BN (tRNA processing enzyme)
MNDVMVKILGSGDAFGSGGRLQTCIYVDTGSVRFLIDCGATALISFKRNGLSTANIDYIFLSHLHGDHFGGIPIFLLDASLISKRKKQLIISGPQGLKSRIKETQEVLYPGTSKRDMPYGIKFLEFKDQSPTKLDQVSVTPYQVIHKSGSPSYALRVDTNGKIITYSGDTEWTESLVKAADQADLFICESNYYDKKVKNHLNYKTLMEHTEKLTCRRLVLTHMGDDMLTRLDELQVDTAEDDKEFFI